MISEKYECVFVHIPKAAGQSIERFFLNLHGLSWKERAPLLLRYNPEPDLGPERLAHLKSSEYVSCGYLDEDQFNRYFKFTFVRNPWARLVSEFRYRDYDKQMSFRDFVLGGLPEECDYSDAYRHIAPQYDFVYDESGKLLVDFVGKFENLQDDFKVVCEALAIQGSTLPHANLSTRENSLKERVKKIIWRKKPSRRYHYTEYYDAETREVVENMYAKDIATFGYAFGD
ncbi:sulfotransferase family protein [Motiliproteus sp. SC1-56]|uniref:sulfotransferase family protein n=1 Tax=Motiliproteus sp. SC1-56 TaxID=2799565 RepID=UPI001A8F2B4D|nr:sulfotransferase family protein [Motiliproteus sp. SC1-56]